MKYLILSLLLITTSCAQIEKRGYAFDLSDHQMLKEEIHDKNDVLNAMGTPSFSSDATSNELWVYYSEDVQKRLFFKPDILDRKIMTISFDNKNIIKKIENYDLSNQNYVGFNQHYTEVASPKKSWWSQILGNIGQVRAN